MQAQYRQYENVQKLVVVCITKTQLKSFFVLKMYSTLNLKRNVNLGVKWQSPLSHFILIFPGGHTQTLNIPNARIVSQNIHYLESVYQMQWRHIGRPKAARFWSTLLYSVDNYENFRDSLISNRVCYQCVYHIMSIASIITFTVW